MPNGLVGTFERFISEHGAVSGRDCDTQDGYIGFALLTLVFGHKYYSYSVTVLAVTVQEVSDFINAVVDTA